MAVSLDDLKIEKNSFQNYGSNRVYCPNSDRIGVTYTSTLTLPWQPSFAFFKKMFYFCFYSVNSEIVFNLALFYQSFYNC